MRKGTTVVARLSAAFLDRPYNRLSAFWRSVGIAGAAFGARVRRNSSSGGDSIDGAGKPLERACESANGAPSLRHQGADGSTGIGARREAAYILKRA
jgi:hypothetical protein